MRKSKLLMLVCLFLVMASLQLAMANQRRPLIGVVQFGVEPNTEVCKQGMLQALAEEGYTDGQTVDIVYKNAQADMALVHSCIQDLARRKVDILVPLATPCLQAAAHVASRSKDLKIVFTNVYDPYKVGVAKSPEDHLPNVTGISCYVPVERILDEIRVVFPDRKDVGMVWNSSEANSEAVVTKARAYASMIGLHLIEVTVTSPAEVLEASRALVNRGANVFLSAADNTLTVAFGSYVKVAMENKIPLFTMDSEFSDSALVVVGPNHFQNGYDGGKYISRVLKGEKVSTLPIATTKETMFIVNMNIARKQGFNVPGEIVKKATKVIGAELKSN